MKTDDLTQQGYQTFLELLICRSVISTATEALPQNHTILPADQKKQEVHWPLLLHMAHKPTKAPAIHHSWPVQVETWTHWNPLLSTFREIHGGASLKQIYEFHDCIVLDDLIASLYNTCWKVVNRWDLSDIQNANLVSPFMHLLPFKKKHH